MKKEQLIDQLLTYFCQEGEQTFSFSIPPDYREKRRLLRGIVNIRPPYPLDEKILKLEDELLQLELKEKKITVTNEIPCIEDQFHVLSVWRGDITTLQVDAIVNAGNTSLLGCFIPNHSCIDNAIHTYTGIRLRLSCNEMMNGKDEKVGQAKLTGAYNLPSQYIIHTVGPMIRGHVTKEDKDKLRSCYYSCLELTQKKQIRTIAFPSISTGVFHFPKTLAAEIAVATVCEFLKDNPETLDRVIFNVFTEEDQEIYERIFRNKKINLSS